MTRSSVSKTKKTVKKSIAEPAADIPTVPPSRRFIKFNASAREEFLRKLRSGMTKTEASESIGVDRTTTYQYRIAHPEFEELVRDAERSAIEQVEDALYKQAKAGNIRAIEVVLYNRAADRWADKGRREAKEPAPVQADPLTAVLSVLDDHPDAKRDLIRRMELMSE